MIRWDGNLLIFQQKEEIYKIIYGTSCRREHVVVRYYNSSEADMFGTEETYDSSNSIVKYLVQNT